jgi:hypothetical protein
LIATLRRNVITDGRGNPEAIEWQIWVQLQPGDPERQREAFVIGEGDIFDVAKAAALTQLRAAMQAVSNLSEMMSLDPKVRELAEALVGEALKGDKAVRVSKTYTAFRAAAVDRAAQSIQLALDHELANIRREVG